MANNLKAVIYLRTVCLYRVFGLFQQFQTYDGNNGKIRECERVWRFWKQFFSALLRAKR